MKKFVILNYNINTLISYSTISAVCNVCKYAAPPLNCIVYYYYYYYYYYYRLIMIKYVIPISSWVRSLSTVPSLQQDVYMDIKTEIPALQTTCLLTVGAGFHRHKEYSLSVVHCHFLQHR